MLDFLREVVKLEWLRKFTAREFFLLALFLAVASIVVRLLSDDFLKAWEITDIGQLRQYSGIAGVLSVVLFVTIFLARLQKWLQHERICYRTKRLFHNLTNHQKQILKNFLDNKDRTRYFQFDDGVVNLGLKPNVAELLGIETFAFFISPCTATTLSGISLINLLGSQ